jgi:long-chain acyl-CoA synthetase
MGSRHTLVHQLDDWATRTPDRPAIHGKAPDGSWSSWTWQGYRDEAWLVGRGLLALGHEAGECVGIVGDNRPEWSLCQFGIMAVRGVPAPIYTTLLPAQAAYIVDHCRARVAICDKQEQLDKLLGCVADGSIPRVETIITMDDLGASSDAVKIITYAQLLEMGQADTSTEAALAARMDALTEDETALLIYTSGTTGTPKAVTLEQGGMVHEGRVCMDRFPFYREPGAYRTVSYLPLCHVAEQLFTTLFHLDSGGEVYYCPDLKKIKDFLVDVRPTFFVGVPRVWEKFQAVLEGKLRETTGIKAKLSAWALRTELEAFKRDALTGQKSESLSRSIANSLVISKIKDALGLDQVRAAGTGAAPIGVNTLEFFASLGITVYEGYGMSETTGLATLGTFGKPTFGSVGRAIEGVTIKIAGDDEILLKGRNMTRGYLHDPDKTAELIDDEGWLHTGDLGSLDDQGLLRITGRKKDILITAGGKNVAPAEMEGHIKAIEGVSQAVVVGDRKPYLSALITLDPEALEALATAAGSSADRTVPALAADAAVMTHLMARIEVDCNAKVARYQTIKKVHLLPVEFTVETGEVTPTMKVKRNVVNDRFADEITGLYA